MREYTRAYTSFLASLCSQAGLQAPSPHAVLLSPSISLLLRLWLTLIHGDNLSSHPTSVTSHYTQQWNWKWEILWTFGRTRAAAWYDYLHSLKWFQEKIIYLMKQLNVTTILSDFTLYHQLSWIVIPLQQCQYKLQTVFFIFSPIWVQPGQDGCGLWGVPLYCLTALVPWPGKKGRVINTMHIEQAQANLVLLYNLFTKNSISACSGSRLNH